MYKIISRKIEKIDAEQALELLKFNTFESQRSLRETHVSYLTHKMLKNEFRTGEIAFAILPNKTTYLMNGQHVLHAIVKSGKTIDNFVERFICDGKEDLSRLFRQYDCNPVRSLTDMIRVEVNALGLDWPYRIAGLIVGAIFKLEKKANTTNRNIRVDLLPHHLSEGHFVVRLLSGSESNRILSRIPVVMAIIQTWRKDSGDSFVFWKGVRDGEMLKKNMPQWKLREFLLKTMLKGGVNKGYQYRYASVKEIWYRCIIAWNAYRRGVKTNLSYHASKPLPKII